MTRVACSRDRLYVRTHDLVHARQARHARPYLYLRTLVGRVGVIAHLLCMPPTELYTGAVTKRCTICVHLARRAVTHLFQLRGGVPNANCKSAAMYMVCSYSSVTLSSTVM